MSFAIVVPSARADNLVRCLRSVLRTHPELDPARVVVVDDGARAGAEPELPPGITWVPGVRPFVYARNVNRGVRACAPFHPVILGDDGELLTPGGLDALAALLRGEPRLAAVSPAVLGAVGNPAQTLCRAAPLRFEEHMLAFVCVMIRRSAWERVGPLDERFTGYGFDDVDYSWRLREAGLALGISSRCVVRHDGSLPSTYRTRPDFRRLNERSRELLRAKWRLPPEWTGAGGYQRRPRHAARGAESLRLDRAAVEPERPKRLLRDRGGPARPARADGAIPLDGSS